MINKFDTENFTLVLSGGGALGIAHLGVLHDLEKSQIIPKEIVGTSMGGIIGACIALGMHESQIYKEIKAFSSLTKWLKFTLQGNAIIDNSKIEDIFTNLYGEKKMQDTGIPLKLIATHLQNGEKKVFSSNDDIFIKDAVLATIAIPGIFSEHTIDGNTYGDGFLCENLGINEAIYHHVLAIDVLGKNSFHQQLPNNFFKTANVIEMFEKSMRLIIYNQSQTHIKHSHKDIYLIEPATKDFTTFSFHKYEEIRSLGLGLLDNILTNIDKDTND